MHKPSFLFKLIPMALSISGALGSRSFIMYLVPLAIPNMIWWYLTPADSSSCFVNSSNSGTYWANVGAGIEGQKLNLIYNNKGSNSISVLANFGSNGIITNTGYSNGLVFSNTGQSSSLVYLDGDINAWQILNTGSGTF